MDVWGTLDGVGRPRGTVDAPRPGDGEAVALDLDTKVLASDVEAQCPVRKPSLVPEVDVDVHAAPRPDDEVISCSEVGANEPLDGPRRPQVIDVEHRHVVTGPEEDAVVERDIAVPGRLDTGRSPVRDVLW